ncbi:MAG TPA: hypothetical protein VLG40_00590 [Candidatus Saccharimonas sp.]|nr:hypothetical protein [Candidatus Saccharimonas sp.]
MSLQHRIRNHPATRKVVGFASRYKLTTALTMAILASLVLVGVGLGMYYYGGFFRYDLSRPGYEKEQAELAKPEPQITYDTTSPVTTKTVDDFLAEFDARQKDLKAYGDYRDPSLTDETLQLGGAQGSQTQ